MTHWAAVQGSLMLTVSSGPLFNMTFHKFAQIKELVVLTLLGLLSRLSNSLLLKDITSTTLPQHGNPFIHSYISVVHLIHPPLNTLFVFLAPSIWLVALFSKHKIPRIFLDCFGGVCVLRAVHALVFINALLFLPAAKPGLLLGQILAYIPFFVMTWGWLIWRIDFCGRELPQQIIAITDAKTPISSFDYYHASIYSILNQGKSGFIGVTRVGRMLGLIHNLMLINIFGLALARAYGLVQKML
jgi:hypothetical protein